VVVELVQKKESVLYKQGLLLLDELHENRS
jgi:hypothetical protein